MLQKKTLVYGIVLLWVALFTASYFMSTRIEGPRNVDTGFRRLDVLARYQIMAFGVAVVAAVVGVIWRRDGKRIMLLGLTPLFLTAVLILGLWGVTMVLNPPLTPDQAYRPPTAAAPAMTQPVQD